MKRSVSASLSILLLPIFLVSAGALLLNLNSCGGNSTIETSFPPPPGTIQHVVIIFQENRTPDNLFHDTVLISRGADIASSGLDSSGNTIPLTAAALGVDYDLSHAHSAFVAMYDGGKMDGANNVTVSCSAGATNCPPPTPQYLYVQASDVGPYYQLAEQYTFGDRMFQTNQGPSFPAHQFIISGTSAPSAGSSMFVAENAAGVPNAGDQTGCLAPPAEYVYLIDANGNENTTMYPCFDHPTLTDELNTKGISWRYYTPSAGSLWTSPNAIQHMCGPNVPPPNATSCVGSDWVNNVVIPETTVLTDISSGKLAQVSWVIPTGTNSDHAGNLLSTGGPSWVASIVNAIGSSPYWSNTAIIIAWDDWGGWYDHVPPPKIVNDGTSWGSGYVYGFRVPLIVVSPYAKAGYISHVNHDFGSILNLIEETFSVPSLGYADAYADDLSDCFDYSQTPIPFKTIDAPLNAAHFLNDKSPRIDPDDD
jgi:phospholipase C